MADLPSPPQVAPERGRGASSRKKAAGKPQKRRAAKAAPGKPKREAPAAPRRPRASTGAQLVARVTSAIEGELTQIRGILGSERVTPARRTEAEKRTRMLASLARTLAEVTRLREAQREGRKGKGSDDNDAVPRDLDEFRATLERRLEQMAAARQDEPDRGDEPA